MYAIRSYYVLGSGTTTSADGYYELVDNEDGTGSVQLTAAGAAFANAGEELPQFTLQVEDDSNATATDSGDPATLTVNDTPSITVDSVSDVTEDSATAGQQVVV